MWGTAITNIGRTALDVGKYAFTNIGVPLFTTWAAGQIAGSSAPRPPQTVANPVRDSSPGTVNVRDQNQDSSSINNTLIIGAAALFAVVLLTRKK